MTRDVQLLINICGQESTDLWLNFSTEKLGIMVFHDSSTGKVSVQCQFSVEKYPESRNVKMFGSMDKRREKLLKNSQGIT